MAVELGPADAGSRPVVRVAEQVTLRLPENPTTGYRWQPEFDESVLRLVEDRYEGAEFPRGAGGQRLWIFEPLRPGSASVKLAQRRSWESGPPTTEYSVELDVKPSD
jgi:inhibitor of cysteine peptidase